MTPLRCFSFGGGVQSMAALVLGVQGKIDYATFVFSNVGDDSEMPPTLRYIEDVAKPYAAANGIDLIEVRRKNRAGETVTLYKEVMREDRRGIDIPIRAAATGAPMNRQCTNHFKSQVVGKWTKAHGATKGNPAIIGLGISIDEWQRVNSNSRIAWHVNEYPLIDLRLSRNDCVTIIRNAGLPVPPKSACWFCPFTRRSEWTRMKQDNPSLFMNAVVFEQDILAKRKYNGHLPAYLTRFGRPLSDVIGDQASLDFDDDDDMCESGYCMT